jgi:hypothetical protein
MAIRLLPGNSHEEPGSPARAPSRGACLPQRYLLAFKKRETAGEACRDHEVEMRLVKSCVCVWVCVITSLCKGAVPFRGGAALPHGSALHSPACSQALRAPSAAHHALPVSGQSSAVHVPLCRCVSCALCENLRAPNRTPHPSRCALPAARYLHL